MKLVDANLLLYATDERSPRHAAARSWLDAVLAGEEPVAFSWAALLAFLRLSTDARIFERPLSMERATGVVQGWVSHPGAVVLHPGDRHLLLLRELLRPLGTGGNLVADAHLAALAIEHAAELCSCDADFSRFSGLRWVNPLDAR